MFLRFHNSCTYYVSDSFFEVRSDVFSLLYRFRGFDISFAKDMLNNLELGVDEAYFNKSALKANYKLECDKFTSFLFEKGLLVKETEINSCQPTDQLYDRQIRFLDSFESPSNSGVDFNSTMQNKTVVIIGLGAYGSWLALHCARLGIKNIIAVDFDVVESSNLPRQILYTKEDVGKFKVDACKKAITASDSEVNYIGHRKKIQNIAELNEIIIDADLVFNSFGYYIEEEADELIPGIITKSCISTKTPMLCLSANMLGPLYIPNDGYCYFCAVNKPEIKSSLSRSRKNPRVDKRAFSPIFSLTCSIAILEMTRYLSGIDRSNIIDKVISINPFDIQKTKTVLLNPDDRCDRCG